MTKNDSTTEDGGAKANLCRSPNVKNATRGLEVAANAINALEKSQRDREDKLKDIFHAKINKCLQDNSINDAVVLNFNSHIKTEFTAEFNMEAATNAITKALKAAAATAAAAEAPFLAPEAIKAYADLVTSLAECAKSSSEAANSLSFDMIHLSPGIIAFLFAVSTTATDKSAFGGESVSCTALFHRIVRSTTAVSKHSEFQSALILARTIEKLGRVQAALVEDLAIGKLTVNEYERLDEQYSTLLDKKKSQLPTKKISSPLQKKSSAKPGAKFQLGAATFAFNDYQENHEEQDNPTVNEEIVQLALAKLQQQGSVSEDLLMELQQRLETGFYS